MILLLGGTSQTAELALGLARCGYRVLVSRATAVPLDVGEHSHIESRSGSLDDPGLAALLQQRQVRAVVDATHPYAQEIHARARRVARQLSVPYLSFLRPTSLDEGDPDITFASDHVAAARLAFADSRPVLLTTGSRNLAPYVAESRRCGISLVVRVLDHPTSLAACHAAGIAPEQVLSGRGPFSEAENRRQIREFGIGVVVTKDGGEAGGSLDKLAAARAEGCRLIVVQRPAAADSENYTSLEALVAALTQHGLKPDAR
jgi:precorrin-6A/cobalt-precorrin-6A reductase